jgi:hypothetical protein
VEQETRRGTVLTIFAALFVLLALSGYLKAAERRQGRVGVLRHQDDGLGERDTGAETLVERLFQTF